MGDVKAKPQLSEVALKYRRATTSTSTASSSPTPLRSALPASGVDVSCGSKEVDLLVQKVRLEAELGEAKAALVLHRQQLADAQDDANELASALADTRDENNDMRKSLSAATSELSRIRISQDHPASQGAGLGVVAAAVAQQVLSAQQALGGVVPATCRTVDAMAVRAAKDIASMQEALARLMGDVDDVGTPAELAARAVAHLRSTHQVLDAKEDTVSRMQRELAATQKENVRLAGALAEERVCARDAAKLRAALATQIDTAAQTHHFAQRRLHSLRSSLIETLSRRTEATLLERFYHKWMRHCDAPLTEEY